MTVQTAGLTKHSKELEDLHRPFHRMDETDLAILNAVRNTGPRNVAGIAKRLGIAPSTISRRLEHLRGNLGLRIMTNVAYHKLGMKRVVLMFEPSLRDEADVLENIRSLSYWYQHYGFLGRPGHLISFKVPAKFLQDYERILNGLGNVYSIKWLEVHILSEILGTGPYLQSYDPEKKEWRIDWLGIKRNFLEAMPFTMSDPANYEIVVDQLDIVILFALESDACMTYSEMAKIAGVSIPTISNRIKRLTKKGLILGHVVNILPYPPEDSRFFYLMLNFPGENQMRKFASGIMETPFLLSFQKEIARNAILARLYMPNSQFLNLSELLRDLVLEGLLTEYSIVELDMSNEQLSTISPELFHTDSGWKPSLESAATKLA